MRATAASCAAEPAETPTFRAFGPGDGLRRRNHQRHAFGQPQAFGGGAAVGTDQPAGAKLDAAVPAGHHHHHAVDAGSLDGLQDRPPRRAAGLAVVVEAVVLADAVGPAVVRGRGIGHLVQEGHRLRGRLHRRGLREEAALADVLRMPAGGHEDVQGFGHAGRSKGKIDGTVARRDTQPASCSHADGAA